MTTETTTLETQPLSGSSRYTFAGEIFKQPFEIESTDGCFLITPSGRRILDAAGGAIVVNIGHGRREVAEAYARGVEQATFVVPPFATPSRVRLVDRLLDRWLTAIGCM